MGAPVGTRDGPPLVARRGIGARIGAALAVVAAAQLLPGMTAIGSVRRLTPRLAGVGAPWHVALTFDDGPAAASTPAVLRALDALGWRATFFMLAAEVRRAPRLAAEVAAAGHEVGVHGERHRN